MRASFFLGGGFFAEECVTFALERFQRFFMNVVSQIEAGPELECQFEFRFFVNNTVSWVVS